MFTAYSIKPKFQALLHKPVYWLAKRQVTPNQLTMTALIISVIYGSFMLLLPENSLLYLGLPLVLFVRMALNAMDGYMARAFAQTSNTGVYLNELADVVADAFLYLPFCFLAGWPTSLVVVGVILAVITEFAAINAAQLGVERRNEGPLGKSDRALVFGTLGFCQGLGFSVAPWTALIFIIINAALLLTIFNRSRAAVRIADHKTL